MPGRRVYTKLRNAHLLALPEKSASYRTTPPELGMDVQSFMRNDRVLKRLADICEVVVYRHVEYRRDEEDAEC